MAERERRGGRRVTHNLPLAFEVADRIVVMNRGRKVADVVTAETDNEAVVGWITGAKAGAGPSRPHRLTRCRRDDDDDATISRPASCGAPRPPATRSRAATRTATPGSSSSRRRSVFREPSGEACNSCELWETDLDLVAGLGLNAYRFSVEWARVEPEPGRVRRRRARALRGDRRRLPRPRPRAGGDVQPLHGTALVRGARRLRRPTTLRTRSPATADG